MRLKILRWDDYLGFSRRAQGHPKTSAMCSPGETGGRRVRVREERQEELNTEHLRALFLKERQIFLRDFSTLRIVSLQRNGFA